MVKYSMKVKSKVHPVVVARGRLLMRNPRAVGYYVRLWVRSLTPATPHIPRLILLTVIVVALCTLHVHNGVYLPDLPQADTRLDEEVLILCINDNRDGELFIGDIGS